MKRMWATIGVRNVSESLAWYQALLGLPLDPPDHEYYGQVRDVDGTVLLCLHRWGDHDHPSLSNPDTGTSGNGLLLFLRVDEFDEALAKARSLQLPLKEEPHINPRSQTMEFSLLDWDGYYVSISARDPA